MKNKGQQVTRGHKTLGIKWFTKCITRWQGSYRLIDSQSRNPQRFIPPNVNGQLGKKQNTMNIIELKERQNISGDIKLSRIYGQLGELLKELKKKELPHKIIESVNQDIEELNSSTLTGIELRKLVKQKQTKIIKLVEKELKITPKNHYRSFWFALGLIFGSGIGVGFGISIGIGIPIGMIIGLAIGSAMDKKAFEEGRQLDVEIKY